MQAKRCFEVRALAAAALDATGELLTGLGCDAAE
jgi:hypothetical protein